MSNNLKIYFSNGKIFTGKNSKIFVQTNSPNSSPTPTPTPTSTYSINSQAYYGIP